MSMDSVLAYWSFQPEFWLIFALVLVGADIVFGLQYFVLSIGVAALLLAGVLLAQHNLWLGEAVVIETWRGVGVWFAVLAVASIFLIKFLFSAAAGPARYQRVLNPGLGNQCSRRASRVDGAERIIWLRFAAQAANARHAPATFAPPHARLGVLFATPKTVLSGDLARIRKIRPDFARSSARSRGHPGSPRSQEDGASGKSAPTT